MWYNQLLSRTSSWILYYWVIKFVNNIITYCCFSLKKKTFQVHWQRYYIKFYCVNDNNIKIKSYIYINTYKVLIYNFRFVEINWYTRSRWDALGHLICHESWIIIVLFTEYWSSPRCSTHHGCSCCGLNFLRHFCFFFF